VGTAFQSFEVLWKKIIVGNLFYRRVAEHSYGNVKSG